MSRAFALAGGLLFVGALLYFGFSYTVRFGDGGAWSAQAAAPAAMNVALFTIFALHHSLFARTRLKAWVTRTWPADLERSIYVWFASLLFLLVCLAWQPVPGVAWHASGVSALPLYGAQLAGAALAGLSATRLDTLTLAGIRQTAPARGEDAQTPSLDETGPYALVRHPIYLGWFLMVWAAPVMNGTRLLFAATSCGYLLLAVPFEERDLRRTFGDAYARYTARVRWRVLPGVY